MPITLTVEYAKRGENILDNSDGMTYRKIKCPFCDADQVFRYRSTEKCDSCNSRIIDGLKLLFNPKYKLAFHWGYVTDNGVWSVH